jgi:hypothetical protein
MIEPPQKVFHVRSKRKSHATDRYGTALETRIIFTRRILDFPKSGKAVEKDVKKETKPFLVDLPVSAYGESKKEHERNQGADVKISLAVFQLIQTPLTPSP